MLPPPPNGPLLISDKHLALYLLGHSRQSGKLSFLLFVTDLIHWNLQSPRSLDPTIMRSFIMLSDADWYPQVATVWVLEFIRSCFMVHSAYFYTVLQWGNPAGLVNAHWSLEAILLMTFLVELLVHLYFTYRVWIISGRKRIVPAIVLFFTISTFVTGVCEYGSSIKEAKFSKIAGGITGVIIVPPSIKFKSHIFQFQDWAFAALSCVIVTDWLITASLVYYLRQCLSETGSSGSNTIVGRLIFYAINIGVLTSAGDLVVLALCASQIPNLYYLALFEIVGNLYANSALASLNARTTLRDTTQEPFVSSIHYHNAAFQNGTLVIRNPKQEESVIPQSMVWSDPTRKREEDIELNMPVPSADRV
ncbi:hypothetical protein BD779DRAFT_1675210 [Infundibulicybe gibba]|nr:hypothetical protein BD779DRAFT_1675210 [Infundibulicybe gibba]